MTYRFAQWAVMCALLCMCTHAVHHSRYIDIEEDIDHWHHDGGRTQMKYNGKALADVVVLDKEHGLKKVACGHDVMEIQTQYVGSLVSRLIPGGMVIAGPGFNCEYGAHDMPQAAYRRIRNITVSGDSVFVLGPSVSFVDAFVNADIKYKFTPPPRDEQHRPTNVTKHHDVDKRFSVSYSKTHYWDLFKFNYNSQSQSVDKARMPIWEVAGQAGTKNFQGKAGDYNVGIYCDNCYVYAYVSFTFEVQIDGYLIKCSGWFKCSGPKAWIEHFLIMLQLGIKANADLTAEAQYSFSNSWERTLFTVPLPTFQIWIGPIPIWIDTKLQMVARTTFSAQVYGGITVGADYSASLSVGYRYVYSLINLFFSSLINLLN
eukprot:Colp12_sorted_trinity150504_noHs@7331